jgi:hypothetical protein
MRHEIQRVATVSAFLTVGIWRWEKATVNLRTIDAGWRKAFAQRAAGIAPQGAAERSPRRKPWDHEFALSPCPLPRSGGGGGSKGAGVLLSQGSRPGLLSYAPSGLMSRRYRESSRRLAPLVDGSHVHRPEIDRGYQLLVERC